MSRQTSKNRLVDKYLNGKINKFPEVSFIKSSAKGEIPWGTQFQGKY